jgi:hypothetical protein
MKIGDASVENKQLRPQASFLRVIPAKAAIQAIFHSPWRAEGS